MGESTAKPIQEPPRLRSKRSWSLSTGAATGSLILRFIGPTSTADIPEFLAALSHNMPKQGAHLIFDLRELEGHNLDARAPIQHWLSDNRSRIEQVTVLVNRASTIIKMAVSVVSLATGMKFEIRDGMASDSSVRRIRR